MRTKTEAAALIVAILERLDGGTLPDTFVLELSSKRSGAPMGLYQTGAMIGLAIAPQRYWQTLPEPVLAAMCCHELANVLHEPPAAMLELVESLAAVDRRPDLTTAARRELRNQTKLQYELDRGLCYVVLGHKLRVDVDAISIQTKSGYPADGYIQFLMEEFQEEIRQATPEIRKAVRGLMAHVRLLHAILVCQGDEASLRHAEAIRHLIQKTCK